MFKISYIYDLVDNISPQLKKIQSNLEQTRSKIQVVAQSMSASFDKVSQSLKQNAQSIKNVGSTLAPMSVAMGGVAIKALSSAANFEKLQMQMEVLTGSAEKGQEVFKKLVEFAAATPFELDELVKANNTLMGFGMNSKDAFNALKMIGDVSAVAGGDLQGITVAFGQAAASGRLMGQDLLQLVNNGVPIIDMLAKSMGVANSQIKDMVSNGDITLPVLIKAFRDATSEGGKFNKGMEKLSTTLGGVYSTLKDSVNIAFAELGSEMAKSINLRQLIRDLSDFASKLTEKFKALSPDAKKFITYAVLIAAVLAPVLFVLGSLVTILGLAFTGLSAIATGFALLVSPIGLVIAAGISLLVILSKILDKFGGIGGAINRFRQDAATVLDFVGLESAANFIAPEINQTINKPQQMTAGGQLDVNIKGLPKGSSAGFTPRPNNFLPVGLNTVYGG